jgi:hypothetical protein
MVYLATRLSRAGLVAVPEDHMPHSRSSSRPRTRQAATLGALALVVSLAPGLAAGAVHADDPTCVGKGEYRQIRGQMSIQKLATLLDGQTPFAEAEGRGSRRIRWYAACDMWQPVKDVMVRYREPVVGRRTVTGKKLAVYEAPTPQTPDQTPDPPRGGRGHR